jgi:hypothetical protein
VNHKHPANLHFKEHSGGNQTLYRLASAKGQRYSRTFEWMRGSGEKEVSVVRWRTQYCMYYIHGSLYIKSQTMGISLELFW